jgi:hypothetical protein
MHLNVMMLDYLATALTRAVNLIPGYTVELRIDPAIEAF